MIRRVGVADETPLLTGRVVRNLVCKAGHLLLVLGEAVARMANGEHDGGETDGQTVEANKKVLLAEDGVV